MGWLSKQKNRDDAAPRRRYDDSNGNSGSSNDIRQPHSFRRNRTITGSSSARIASGNELNAQLRSPRAHAHHLAMTRRRILSYLAIVLTACGLLYVLLSQVVATQVVQIPDIEQPLSSVQAKPYQEAAEAYFRARPVERLRFLLNEDAFLSNMQASNPEVESVRLDQGTRFGEALMTLEVRKPIARWNTSEQQRYVDARGVVFTKNYFAKPAVTIRDNSGVELPSDQVVTSQRFLGFVGQVIGYAKNQNFTVKTATIPALTTRQIRVTMKGVGPYFTLSVDRPPAEQVEDMTRIVKYLRTHGKTAEYVDVRVAGKAFYR